ncbi:MAG: hypothetical protein OXU74_04365 [Gemmatimonadota bacterium]|nr:hypothetical protein [Gemmatimonadota bacterium]
MRRIGPTAVVVFGLVGCEAGLRPTGTSRDSLGVRIVESVAPAWREGAGWRVEAQPLVDLAESGTGDMHLFLGVRDVLRARSGHLVVADGGSQQIRVYDADGLFLRAFGGPGEGPGEFRILWSVVETHASALLGVDFALGASAAEFDIDSGLISTFRVPGGATSLRHPVPSDLVWGLEAGYTMEDEDLESGLQRHPAMIVRMSEDRTSVHAVAQIPGNELFFLPEVEVNPVMGRMTHVVPTGRGEVVVGLADGLEYSILDGQTGDVHLIARIPGISLAVTEEEVDRERQVRLGRNPRPYIRDLLDRLPIPTRKPAYQNMLLDAEGNVWAGEFLGLARRYEPQDWYVWDSSGVWLGVVETPARFEVMRVGVNEVFGVGRDLNDVEHPQVLRLVKPQG